MNNISLNTSDFISNQNLLKGVPYGSRGTVDGGGCGSIACFHFLFCHGFDIKYSDVYEYFNDNRRLVFKGKWGTNPFSVKKYLKMSFGFKVKMHFFRIPKKPLKSCIILNIFKIKKGLGAHYVFGYAEKDSFNTYNLNREYNDVQDYLKKSNTIGRLFVVYEINS